VVARIASLGYTVTKQAEPYQYGILDGLKGKLRQIGVLGNKHIPRQYLDGGLAQRTVLMQGPMDTDG